MSMSLLRINSWDCCQEKANCLSNLKEVQVAIAIANGRAQ